MSADLSATSGHPVPSAQRERRWLPVLAVLVVIAVVDGGGTLLGKATDQAAGTPQMVGGAVRIQPLPGWAAAEPLGAAPNEFTLTRGAVTFDVLAVHGPVPSVDELATRYVEGVLRPRFEDLAIGHPERGSLGSGVPALRFGYIGLARGVPIEGVATVAVGATTGAVFDAVAPKGDLAWAAADLDAMIRGAEVG
jgi:hypothetical protein